MARTKKSTKTRNTQKQKVIKTTADKTEQEEQVTTDKTYTNDSKNLITNCTSLRDTNESFIASDIACKDNSLMQTSLLDYATKNTTNERENIEQEVNDNTLNLMDENMNVNDTKSPILIIDTSNPKNIYRDFVALKMPIGQFISELPDLHQKQVKKLCIITMNKAVKMDDLLKMTTEKDRNTRLLATTCVLHKIKTSYATKSKIDFADTFYDIVETRMRDISHNIRAVCFEYLFDICKHIDLKVKYINHGLDDKSDVVRKNTIKGLQQYIAKKNIPSIKAKIIQLCQYEKNDSNKKEACKLLLLMYSLQMVTSEEIFAVLDNFSEREMQDLYEHLKSQKNVVDVLHEFNENALDKIKLNEEDMKTLLDCIKNDTQYLRILSAVVKANNCIIAELVDFLDIYKEDVENIKHIIKALTIIDTKYYTAEYEQVIENLYDILLNYRDNAVYESIFKLYHKLQDAYPKVNIVLERIKYSDNSVFLPFILKYFDFSDFVYDTESLETKMLSSFWKIKNQNFMSIANYNLDITHSLEFDIACNYILHMKTLIKERYETQEIYDEATALNYLYHSLCTNAYKYLDTYDKSIADSYIQISHILPIHKYLFACNRQQIMKHLHNTKNVDDIFIDHFFLAISGKNSLSLTDIKVLSMNASKKLKNCNVYNWLLRFVTEERLYDNSFVFFVKFLRSEECKILAKLVKIKCKYKTSLLAKCKCHSDSIVGNKTKENDVNDVEDIDSIDKDKMNDKGQQEGISETNIDDEEKKIVLL